MNEYVENAYVGYERTVKEFFSIVGVYIYIYTAEG